MKIHSKTKMNVTVENVNSELVITIRDYLINIFLWELCFDWPYTPLKSETLSFSERSSDKSEQIYSREADSTLTICTIFFSPDLFPRSRFIRAKGGGHKSMINEQASRKCKKKLSSYF